MVVGRLRNGVSHSSEFIVGRMIGRLDSCQGYAIENLLDFFSACSPLK